MLSIILPAKLQKLTKILLRFFFMLEKHYKAIYPEAVLDRKKNKRGYDKVNLFECENPSNQHTLKKTKCMEANFDTQKIGPIHLPQKQNPVHQEYEYNKKPMNDFNWSQEIDASYYETKNNQYPNGSDIPHIKGYKQKEESYYHKSMDLFASVCNGISLSHGGYQG